MKMHVLMHVPFEGPACIAGWAADKGIELVYVKLFAGQEPPSDTGFLVVMGGPMGVYDEDRHPFLAREKEFIRATIAKDRPTVGICLGAQLIAHVLGAKVHCGWRKETGWLPVQMEQPRPDSAAGGADIFKNFPPVFTALHWHSDMFDIPAGAQRAARSRAVENQAFSFNSGRVAAVQFHMEATAESVGALVENCPDDMRPEGECVQNAGQILSRAALAGPCNVLMKSMLDCMLKTVVSP